MADKLSSTQRKYCMSRIRGKNTKPEILVMKGLHARGFRFRLHNKKLPGSPDIVLPKYGVAVMVNGCFCMGTKDVDMRLSRKQILSSGKQRLPGTVIGMK